MAGSARTIPPPPVNPETKPFWDAAGAARHEPHLKGHLNYCLANQFVNGRLTIAAALARWPRWTKKLARDRAVNRRLSMMWRIGS